MAAREVPVGPGLPEGWKAIEKTYGPESKYAGKTYLRYYSLDGKHKHITNGNKVITVHYESLGQDPKPHLEEYRRLQNEKQEANRVEQAAQKEKKGEERKELMPRFRAEFGALKGTDVFHFPGWRTKWQFQPKCNQVMITYVDPRGKGWKLLQELECEFQKEIDKGHGKELSEMIRTAQAKGDEFKEKFKAIARRAHEEKRDLDLTPEDLAALEAEAPLTKKARTS